MSNQSWDIIATASAGPDAAWFAFSTARTLSRHRNIRVTLYIDALDDLARQVPGVDPEQASQIVQGFRLVDHRAINANKPSNHCLVVFDSIVPRRYFEQRARATCGSWFFYLSRLGVDSMGRSEWQNKGINAIELWNGTAELGFMKPACDAIEQRDQLRAQRITADMPARSVAIPARRERAKRVLTVMPDDTINFSRWIQAWMNSPEPLHIRIPKNAISGRHREAFTGMWHQGTDLVAGNLTITPLPEMSWAEMDRVIWSSDLLMTHRQDIAMRAMISGTPIVAPLTGRLRVHHGQVVCHAMGLLPDTGSDTALKSVADLARSWFVNHQEIEKWQIFCTHWDDVQTRAREMARQMQQVPDLTDSMLELTKMYAAPANSQGTTDGHPSWDSRRVLS